MAWDIETTGLRWDVDSIATCQIDAADAGTHVVQEIKPHPPNLAAVLASPHVAKVFHHAPFDLRFLTHHWGTRPENVLCTKVASRILNPDRESAPHSLQALLRHHLGVLLDKSERLSDWLAPELTAKQIEYAVGDVRYLVPLLEALRKELRSAGLLELYEACCAHLLTRVQLEIGGWPDVYSY